MNIKRAKEEITATVRAYLARDEVGAYRIPTVRQRPILLMGPPGIGKTQIMEQIARELDVALVSYTITPHTRQSALGLPFIREKVLGGESRTVTEYTMSEILSAVYTAMEDTGRREGILFLDEVNCISETLAPMMLQFLQCKTFGNQPLPQGWVLVTAGNPPEYNKSVREFDIVTLDRVRRMDVEADYAVWKEYAQRRALHGAVLTYLELRPDQFYQIRRTAEGLEFVTARGWEDLSELLYVYEDLGQAVDQTVVGEYLQCPQVAADFAAYWLLYNKYRQAYRVEELLAGQWTPLQARELAQAPFDERLSVLGLVLSALRRDARQAWRLDKLTDRLHRDLLAAREALGTAHPARALTERREELEREETRQGSGGDREVLRLTLEERGRLEELGALLEGTEEDPQGAFQRLKGAFQDDVDRRAAWAGRVEEELERAFAFLEEALGEGQEMVLFATELTADYHLSWFIQTFGCQAYYRHNRALLYQDTQGALLEEIARAESAGQEQE